MRALRIASCAVALVTIIGVPGVRAQESNQSRRLTYLTFSAPVQLPGVTLPAGTYRFQLASTQTGLHAVQVFSRDGKHLYTTFPTVPDIRSSADTPRETVVMFAESAPGAPQAVRLWFYAGNPAGEQFVYPRHQALEIAKANHTTVLSTDDDRVVAGDNAARADAVNAAPVTRVDESGNAPREEAQVASAEPAVAPPPQAAAPAPAPRRRLPQTAGNLALFELLSALCLAGGLTVGRVRRNA